MVVADKERSGVFLSVEQRDIDLLKRGSRVVGGRS